MKKAQIKKDIALIIISKEIAKILYSKFEIYDIRIENKYKVESIIYTKKDFDNATMYGIEGVIFQQYEAN